MNYYQNRAKITMFPQPPPPQDLQHPDIFLCSDSLNIITVRFHGCPQIEINFARLDKLGRGLKCRSTLPKSFLTWIIHESRASQMRGAADEAVAPHPENPSQQSRHRVTLARLKDEKCR